MPLPGSGKSSGAVAKGNAGFVSGARSCWAFQCWWQLHFCNFLRLCHKLETCKEAASLDVLSASEDINLLFCHPPFRLQKQRDSPSCRLCSSLHVLLFSLLVIKLLPIFHTLRPVGFSPWYTREQRLWSELLSNLKKQTNMVVFIEEATVEYLMRKPCVRPCAKNEKHVFKKQTKNAG